MQEKCLELPRSARQTSAPLCAQRLTMPRSSPSSSRATTMGVSPMKAVRKSPGSATSSSRQR